MIEARAYQAGDVLALNVQGAQAGEAAGRWRDWLRTTRPAGEAWSFWRGEVLVCVAGIEPEGDTGRAVAWALIGAPRRAEWGFLLRFGRERLTAGLRRYRRIVAEARCDWPSAQGALARLGFRCEAPVMAAFGPDGSDYALWAMTRRGDQRHGR